MFTLAHNLYSYVRKSREKNLTIILIGLDNAGKTTLLYGLRNELPKADVTPTIGFRPSKLVSGKYTIQWFDVGGAKNFRRVWQSYYPEVRPLASLRLSSAALGRRSGLCGREGVVVERVSWAGAWRDLRS